MKGSTRTVLDLLLVVAFIGAFCLAALTGGITYIPEDTMEQVRAVLPSVIVPATLVFSIGLPLIHAIYTMGWQPAVKFFVVGYIVAWIFEDLSVRTGIVFGFYWFPEMMGPKIDQIPMVIPMFWLMCFYMAYYVSNLLYHGSPLPKDYSVRSIIESAFIGGLILTTLDLSTDPFAEANGFWIWVDQGPYFGVPFHNFIGWFATGFITYIIHGFMLRHDKKKYGMELKTNRQKGWTIAPVIEYLLFCLVFMVMNVHEFLAMTTFFAMGIPVTVALLRWFQWYYQERELPDGKVAAADKAATPAGKVAATMD
jgi:uncharacterized membrane protein